VRARRIALAILAVLIAVVVPAIVAAHHGSAISYDVDPAKVITMKGTVVEWVWRNPHCFVVIDVADASGKTVRWTAETSSTQSMTGEHGWSRTTLKPGDVITIGVFPSRASTPAGLLYRVAAADGKVLLDDESRLRNAGR
jgi:hypothetical protein